jgi:hypothetical protein
VTILDEAKLQELADFDDRYLLGVTNRLAKQSKRQSMAPVEKPPRIDPARVQQEQEEGHKAGIAFATVEAEYRDLLMLRKFLESPCDSDFAAELFSHYPDLSYGEFADRLFGDEEAEPSDDFILAFARAAVEVLEEIERRKLTGGRRRHERP